MDLNAFEKREIFAVHRRYPGRGLLVKFYPTRRRIDYHVMKSDKNTAEYAAEKAQFTGFNEIGFK
jgi:hypothetical protein